MYWFISLMFLGLVLLGGANIYGAWLLIKERRRNEMNEQLIQGLRDNIATLCASIGSVGERVMDIERQFKSMDHRQKQIELREEETANYTQAVNLVRHGADVEELIANCGITRGEAELISRMYATPHHIN
ncbi:MAG TPA: hypothetical protein DCZ03_14280 [Gammaproteobacteria bacterium]|nr:hypothetical protein [Gammaproteobacteria bacterium]